ncbi:MAG: trypsin-like peptidase domain-containing protein [Nanoarchaeota archaeon]
MAIRGISEEGHHIVLKRHHKIILGSVSSLLIILIIINSIMLYFLYGQLELSYNELTSNIHKLEADTNSKIGSLSDSVISTKQELSSLGSNLSQQLNLLKASAGEDFSGIIEDAVQSVVTIKTDIAQGTGFIISTDGYIVTNYHVVEGAKAAVVITSDGENHQQVSLIGYDSNLDIALLKIDGTYNKLTLANSDNVNVGEKVIAIGNPLGLQFSVSQGIVSAVHREGSNGLQAYIQTDAALNPGNSGGPLINTDGKVIGINNFKIGSSESLGFALESNYIKDAVNSISQQALNQTLV